MYVSLSPPSPCVQFGISPVLPRVGVRDTEDTI
jgi:hypothetical protein